jgi:nitric oxide reductase subunit C
MGLKKDSLPLKYTRKLLHTETTATSGKRLIEKYNCPGCHKIGKEGGSIGPALTGEAKKSRSEWMFGFLKNPYKIRPENILKARMPDFRLSDKEVNTIMDYLAFMSGEPYPFYSVQKEQIQPEDILDGEKLYREIFACSACHRVNDSGGQVGPDHTDLASRLKRKWLETWLKDPQAIKPDVIMPRFTFKDWEFKALTDYLMTMGSYRFVQVKNSN